MTHAESIVLTLIPFGERRQAAPFTNAVQPVAAAGQDLVYVSLMTDVPHQPVVGRVVNIMQGDG